MPTTLPVPISFTLPNEHWRPVDPEALGVTNAAFLAVRAENDGVGYSPTLTVSGGLRTDPASLDDIGDEAVGVFATEATEVELVTRRDYGSPEAPGLLQVVGGTLTVEQRTFDLRQAHVLIAMTDVRDAQRRVVVKVVLSTTFGQFQACLPDLQDFVATLHPEQPDPEQPDPEQPDPEQPGPDQPGDGPAPG